MCSPQFISNPYSQNDTIIIVFNKRHSSVNIKIIMIIRKKITVPKYLCFFHYLYLYAHLEVKSNQIQENMEVKRKSIVILSERT